MKIILAIETSCDDTSASVVVDGTVVANIVSSQSDHSKYGGVVPELASRQHNINILPVVELALAKANISKQSLTAIAVTQGPGLLGSLHVGVSFAKSLALALSIPIYPIHHMQAHILSQFMSSICPRFPYLCLTVSGGHTQIVLVKSFSDMTILGETIDDAAGEAFDKTGKMLGFNYPAGPIIDKYAQLGEHKFKFSKPDIEGYNFSFSGFKTSVLYFINNMLKLNPNFISENLYDLCSSIQNTIIQILLQKIKLASMHLNINQIAVAGGVAANSGLKSELVKLGKGNNLEIYFPDTKNCTDNAGMIGIAAYYQKPTQSTQLFSSDPRLSF